MELDELKDVWAAHGRTLEMSLAIDERLLREMLLGKVRVALAPYVLWRGLEAACGIAFLMVSVPVLGAHLGEPRYVVAGGTVAVFIAAMTVLSCSLLGRSLALDYGRPVTVIQRDLERIRALEYRAVKWGVLGGIVAWLPAALLLFEALTRVDALGRVPAGWLIGNLVFGWLCLGWGLLLARRYLERPLGPRARRIFDALSGRGVRSAARHLAELASFQRDSEDPAAR